MGEEKEPPMKILIVDKMSALIAAESTDVPTGTFFTPVGTSVVYAANGNCNAGLGKVASAGTLIVDSTLNANGCFDVTSDTEGTITFNKKGRSITSEITAEQCFQDANGEQVIPTGFCGDSETDAHTSTVDGTFTITDGTGKFAGATGSGTFTSEVNHCDSEFPLGNSFKSKFKGVIELVDDEDDQKF